MQVCKQCEDVVEEMRAMVVAANSSCSGQLEAFLQDKVCSQLPPDVAKECVADVHAALPRIWAMLINQVLDPGKACAAIGACGGHSSQKQEGQAGVAAAPGVRGIVDCKMCKQVTKEIAKELEDPAYQAKVVAELEQVCRQLPNTTPAMQDKCAAQVDKEGPVLMTQISALCLIVRV